MKFMYIIVKVHASPHLHIAQGYRLKLPKTVWSMPKTFYILPGTEEMTNSGGSCGHTFDTE